MVASLKEFHDHKQAILDAGARRGTKGMIDNFLIPKLELLQSFTAFTKDIGALIQWTADVTERLLITHCKLPFERTSRQSCTFTDQIVDILNREESMRRFQLYLFLRMHDTPLTNTIVTEEQEITETDPALAWIAHVAPGDPNQCCSVRPRPIRNHFLKGILSSTTTTAFHVTVTPDRAKISINEVQQLYALPDFGRALFDYIAKASNVKSFKLLCHQKCFLWETVMRLLFNQYMATGQVQAIFQPIPPRHVTLPHYLTDQPLLYVQYYEIVGYPRDEPATSMYTVAQQCHDGPGGQRMRSGAVIPLTDITHAVELIPIYGTGADRRPMHVIFNEMRKIIIDQNCRFSISHKFRTVK
ncbi:hypothetical protein F4604DRAFT_1986709 [Suillus subluteus]|nr:hypothetical protein F4604DRAFT_1986709 [Suillus subluteus]